MLVLWQLITINVYYCVVFSGTSYEVTLLYCAYQLLVLHYQFLCWNMFILQSIADSELEQELGITNSLHRLKLRLAVHEIVSITSTEKLHRTVRLNRPLCQ